MANITFSEGSGLQDSVFGNSQSAIRLFIEKKGEAFEQRSVLKNIFAMDKSSHWSEKLCALTAMDGFTPVGENGAYPLDGMRESYGKTLEHVTWKNSFSLSREIIEDSKVIDLRKKPAGFVTSFYRTREKYGAALIGAAVKGLTTTTYGGKSFSTAAADGLSLFSKAHTSILGNATQSNCYSDAFSATALGGLEAAMQGFKGDNDEILDCAPDTIIIPNLYALKNSVFGAIGADKDPATANNAFNYQFGRWNVIVWPYLNQYITASTAPWILMDSRYNEENGGAVWLDRTELDVRSTIDENTDANVWRGYARFVAGFNDWRAFIVGGVTGGTALA